MPPQVRPVQIQYELEKTLNATGLDYQLDIYKSLLGHEGKNVEPLVQISRRSLISICSKKRSNTKPPTAPASGPTPTFTMNWESPRSRSARAAGASARATKK